MSEFSHLKNKLLAEQVEDQIYHYILDEALEPGAKLPNEFALGEKFRVGRSTIREAVKLLSSKGIVEVRQGSGTYVVTTVKGLSDPLNLRSVQDKNALAFDLVNVRLLLEPGIAEMAAQNATPEDIERLRRLCERVEAKIHEGDRYIEDDIAFHTCIAESSKNLVVGQLIERTRSMAGKARPWILLSALTLSVASVLMFVVPFEGTARYVWIAIAYNLYYAVAYPIYNTANATMVPVSTRDSEKRRAARARLRFGKRRRDSRLL